MYKNLWKLSLTSRHTQELILQRRHCHPTPVLLPGKSHGGSSLEGYSPWGRWGSHTTERLHFHFSLSCIGEGNGNPLQCPCLENPRDGGAWWAALYGVAQSRTPLKRLSSIDNKNVIKTYLLFYNLDFFHLSCNNTFFHVSNYLSDHVFEYI